ncbi:MAG TPA: hypothetical protein VL460_06690 [Caulobacteraceae bacterium]|nr:hypothetical protein [Caulobacteraceae bacterium]
MAKAQFHKHQKVWVESVGAWATIEKIQPIWAKGFDEPVRITYEVGLGREFQAHELRAEDSEQAPGDEAAGGEWRLMRARNKWQPPEDCAHHPFPGTFPVVVTDETDWGGWRVPGAEYDRDPFKIEMQARLVAAAPKLMRIARELAEFADETSGEAPAEVVRLGRAANAILRSVAESPTAPTPNQPGREEAA